MGKEIEERRGQIADWECSDAGDEDEYSDEAESGKEQAWLGECVAWSIGLRCG
jgi:hypothetical protein